MASDLVTRDRFAGEDALLARTAGAGKEPTFRMESRVAAVVVTFNRREIVLECLSSLFSGTRRPDEVIVVDNGSSDGTADAIRARYPKVRLLSMGENLGPAGGFNRGMRAALQLDCDWIMVLGDDVFLEADTLRSLLQVAAGADGTVAMVAPVVPGNPPRIWRHWAISLPVVPSHPGQSVPPIEVDMVVYNAPLIRADVVRQLGGPREDYVVTWWEWEYGLRLRQRGYRILILPDARVRHLALGSAALGPSSRVLAPWYGYYLARNHLRLILERRSVIDGLFWAFHQTKWLATLPERDHRGARVWFRLLGAIDALRGRMGRTVVPQLTTKGW